MESRTTSAINAGQLTSQKEGSASSAAPRAHSPQRIGARQQRIELCTGGVVMLQRGKGVFVELLGLRRDVPVSAFHRF